MRNGKIAAICVTFLLGAACHRSSRLPSPPAVPAAQATQPTRPAETQPVSPPPASQQPVPTQPPAQQPPPPAPQFRLGQTLTPEEQRANNLLLDQHLQHTTQALGAIGNRRLSSEQKATVAQIRGFMEQARQMRATDLIRARSLAERADVLTQDLVSRLRSK